MNSYKSFPATCRKERVQSGGAGIRRRSDYCSCALAKGEPEEGGFPGRAFEEGLRLSICSVVRLSTVYMLFQLPPRAEAVFTCNYESRVEKVWAGQVSQGVNRVASSKCLRVSSF